MSKYHPHIPFHNFKHLLFAEVSLILSHTKNTKITKVHFFNSLCSWWLCVKIYFVFLQSLCGEPLHPFYLTSTVKLTVPEDAGLTSRMSHFIFVANSLKSVCQPSLCQYLISTFCILHFTFCILQFTGNTSMKGEKGTGSFLLAKEGIK